MSMIRAELNHAFREAIAMEFVDVPKEDSVVAFSFSNRFEQRMRTLIRRQKKNYWKYVNTAKKRVAIAVITMFSILMLALGNDEVRASMLQWCADVYDTHIHFYFEGDTTKEIEYEYYLTMVPDGFEMVREQKDSRWIVIEYENKKGDCIVWTQSITEGTQYIDDNENGEWSTSEIRNLKVRLYDYKSVMGAIWIEDGYLMNLTYYGCEDITVIEEMIRTIE